MCHIDFSAFGTSNSEYRFLSFCHIVIIWNEEIARLYAPLPPKFNLEHERPIIRKEVLNRGSPRICLSCAWVENETLSHIVNVIAGCQNLTLCLRGDCYIVFADRAFAGGLLGGRPGAGIEPCLSLWSATALMLNKQSREARTSIASV